MTDWQTPGGLEIFALDHVPLVAAGDDLADVLTAAVATSDATLLDHDVVVIAQKVVSKAEDRLVALPSVTPSAKAEDIAAVMGKDPRIIELVLRESVAIVRQTDRLIITENHLGLVMANAGIDQSNVPADTALLLPLDPDHSAFVLQEALQRNLNAKVSVVIADSIGRAWRHGIVGHAIGVAGLPALVNLRNAPDLYGKELRVSEIALADSIAAAANLVMGQGDEGRPFAVVRGLGSQPESGCARDLIRPIEQDLFR